MATEARRPHAARVACHLSRPAACSLLAACAWLALCGFSPKPASAQDTPPAEPSDAVREVTVRGNKADALQRASGSGTSIGEREIKNAQPESTGELLRRVPGLQLRTEDPMGFRLNLGVHGLSPTRSRLILMEEDGVPVVVSPYGEPELYYTPM